MSVEDCLANTGSQGGLLAVLGVAFVIVGLGVLALLARKRKGVGTVIGALVLIGALAVLPLASPSSAQAAAGDCAQTSQAKATQDPTPDSDTTPKPEPTPTPEPEPEPQPEPEITYVSPEAPTTAPVCGAAPVVVYPESDYFEYATVVVDDDTVGVSATLKSGLEGVALDPGAQTYWTFDMSFTPVVTPSDISFSYGWTTPEGTPAGYLHDAETAAYLDDDQDATLAFVTEQITWALYGVFDSSGNLLTEPANQVYYPTNTTHRFAVEQSGQDLLFTLLDTEGSSDGQASAVAHFEGLGALPEGASVLPIPGTGEWIPEEGTLSVTISDACGNRIDLTSTSNPPG